MSEIKKHKMQITYQPCNSSNCERKEEFTQVIYFGTFDGYHGLNLCFECINRAKELMKEDDKN